MNPTPMTCTELTSNALQLSMQLELLYALLLEPELELKRVPRHSAAPSKGYTSKA